MSVRFSTRQKEGIVRALREAAARYASSVGMRKTTVDELAAEAGISKGAFYKFYPSKEHLFLDVLEQWYIQIIDGVSLELNKGLDLPPRQRAERMLKTAWRLIRKQPLIRFYQMEIPQMLRKLPEPLVEEHFLSADQFISKLIERSGLDLAVSPSEACAVVKMLFLSVVMAPEIGAHFETALDMLVEGACQRLTGRPDAQCEPIG